MITSLLLSTLCVSSEYIITFKRYVGKSLTHCFPTHPVSISMDSYSYVYLPFS